MILAFSEPKFTTSFSSEASILANNKERSRRRFLGISQYVHKLYWEYLTTIFTTLKDEWERETMLYSDVSKIVGHPAYRKTISLGKAVLPLIIEDLKATDNHWFYALEAISGHNPIKEEHRGIIPAMKQDWIDWYEKEMR